MALIRGRQKQTKDEVPYIEAETDIAEAIEIVARTAERLASTVGTGRAQGPEGHMEAPSVVQLLRLAALWHFEGVRHRRLSGALDLLIRLYAQTAPVSTMLELEPILTRLGGIGDDLGRLSSRARHVIHRLDNPFYWEAVEKQAEINRQEQKHQI